MTTSAQLLLAWQNKQTAKRKPGLSFSAIGGCHRRAGYLLAGTPATNASGSVQSAMGSAAHDKIAEAAREMFPNDLVEHRVEFAGISGTLDRFDAERGELIDTKTTSDRWLQHIKIYGISREWKFQTAGYAAGLMQQGHKVRTIRLDVLARDTGEEWQDTRKFDVREVGEAFEWVRAVRETPLDMLNRDYEPDGPMCKGCPFFDACWEGATVGRDKRSVLLVEDPDKAKWARQLWDARQLKKQAEALEAEARGALDALRPVTEGSSDLIDVGFEHLLKWTVSTPQRLNAEAVRAEYAKVGAKPPIKDSKPTVKLEFVSREDSEK